MSLRKRMLRHGPRTGVLAASIGALIATGGLASSSAWAQDEEAEDEATEEGNSDEDVIIVTGTRIRRDDFSALTATTVVTADDMRNLGVVSVADMVNQLPNNIATISPEATADSPFYLGASIANMRGLNPAFGVRTLTLLDSRRMTPTDSGGGVDLNFIPSALVGRIETVTGGNSATYGADAMAGVVNVILDDNIDNIRVDLNYYTSDYSDGDQYTFSLGTGAQFFEGRGRFTIGLDSSRQDAIEDCTTREVCQRGLGLFRNGQQETGNLRDMYNGRGNSIIFEGEPEWMIQTGHRYSTTPTGVITPESNGSEGYPCATYVGNMLDTTGCATLADYRVGWYTFTEDGTDMIPIYTADQVSLLELAAIDEVGTQTGLGFSLQGDGNRWSTPYGAGRSIYADVPIRPQTDRDNLFVRFTYELEGGIEIGADLTYGQTRSESLQNSARNNLQQFCVMPANAYVQPEIAGETLRNVYNSRLSGGLSTNGYFQWFFNSQAATESGCEQAPFFGDSLLVPDVPDDNNEEGQIPLRFDFAPGVEIHKDFSTQVDRRNINDTDATSITLSANGTLFEGGSWTWDSYAQIGGTERRQTLSGWRAARRWDMAIDSVIDGWDTDGDGQVDVLPTDPMPVGAEPVIVCSVDAQNAVFLRNGGNVNNPADFVNWGGFMRDRWHAYLYQALAEDVGEDQLDQIYDDYVDGCEPFNPFGSQPLTDAQKAYVFPTLYEGTDNDQLALSLSFSGDAWRGIGDAGPMRMAAGIDWRENETQNIADPNRFLGADFNFVGNSAQNQSVQRIYGDNWHGQNTTKEAFVEFDLPLLRDRPGVDFLAFNTSFRRSENTTKRISGLESVAARNTTRDVDSWRASLQWQPVDLMRVRVTRSADTRAPSSNELFATNSYATETGGQLEFDSPWRYNYQDAQFLGQNADRTIVLQAGNSSLRNEKSITETFGLVFQPSDALAGLQISVDYYQTTIEAGIRQIDWQDTIDLCAYEIGEDRWGTIPYVPENEWQFCQNIVFGTPDPTQEFFGPNSQTGYGGTLADIIGPDGVNQVAAGVANPYYAYTNVVSVAESSVNEEDYISRGIDYSISYTSQLAGGGSITGRGIITRYLEQQVFLLNTFGPRDVSGQTGGNNIGNYLGAFSVNYSATPRMKSNLYITYQKDAFSLTAQAIYTGAGKLNLQNGWLAPGESNTFTPYAGGSPIGPQQTQMYDSTVERTVQVQDLPSWTTFNLNFNYDFGRSRLELNRFESLSAYLNIENVGDRVPGFFSGTGAGGINTSLFSAMGRAYRMGVRMEF